MKGSIKKWAASLPNARAAVARFVILQKEQIVQIASLLYSYDISTWLVIYLGRKMAGITCFWKPRLINDWCLRDNYSNTRLDLSVHDAASEAFQSYIYASPFV